MSDHPLLRDPERRRAYELLLANPAGTFRSWAQLLGWTAPRTQRFIESCAREGFLEVAANRHWGTRLKAIDRDT
ncbi:MAG: hypothetical protein M3O61_18715, partial [Gemmatimonadota bacterium]|nr:hypothetical protein [Gemmatimonadota bacterium]